MIWTGKLCGGGGGGGGEGGGHGLQYLMNCVVCGCGLWLRDQQVALLVQKYC